MPASQLKGRFDADYFSRRMWRFKHVWWSKKRSIVSDEVREALRYQMHCLKRWQSLPPEKKRFGFPKRYGPPRAVKPTLVWCTEKVFTTGPGPDTRRPPSPTLSRGTYSYLFGGGDCGPGTGIGFWYRRRCSQGYTRKRHHFLDVKATLVE